MKMPIYMLRLKSSIPSKCPHISDEAMNISLLPGFDSVRYLCIKYHCPELTQPSSRHILNLLEVINGCIGRQVEEWMELFTGWYSNKYTYTFYDVLFCYSCDKRCLLTVFIDTLNLIHLIQIIERGLIPIQFHLFFVLFLSLLGYWQHISHHKFQSRTHFDHLQKRLNNCNTGFVWSTTNQRC